MKISQVNKVHFSPNGTTKEVVETVCEGWKAEAEPLDLLKTPLKEELLLSKDHLLAIGLPVYAGRLPGLCREMLRNLKGDGTPAVAMVVYGNRDYDDALLELKDILEGNGFHVIAAGAFVAQHSIFPKVAAGRPDAQDKTMMGEFAARCAEILASFDGQTAGSVQVKGNPEYKAPASVPLKPTGNASCTGCGACVNICPTQSISSKEPKKTKKDTCISCGACIQVCPVNARGFHGLIYQVAEKEFVKKNSAYRKPELFY